MSDIIKQRAGVKEIAAALNLSPVTVRRLARQGRLPSAKRIGKNWSFDVERINRFFSK